MYGAVVGAGQYRSANGYANGSNPQITWQVDFPNAKDITNISVLPHNSNLIYKLKVSLKISGTWTEIKDFSTATGTFDIDLLNVTTCTGVRLYIYYMYNTAGTGNYRVGFRNFQIIEKVSGYKWQQGTPNDYDLIM